MCLPWTSPSSSPTSRPSTRSASACARSAATPRRRTRVLRARQRLARRVARATCASLAWIECVDTGIANDLVGGAGGGAQPRRRDGSTTPFFAVMHSDTYVHRAGWLAMLLAAAARAATPRSGTRHQTIRAYDAGWAAQAGRRAAPLIARLRGREAAAGVAWLRSCLTLYRTAAFRAAGCRFASDGREDATHAANTRAGGARRAPAAAARPRRRLLRLPQGRHDPHRQPPVSPPATASSAPASSATTATSAASTPGRRRRRSSPTPPSIDRRRRLHHGGTEARRASSSLSGLLTPCLRGEFLPDHRPRRRRARVLRRRGAGVPADGGTGAARASQPAALPAAERGGGRGGAARDRPSAPCRCAATSTCAAVWRLARRLARRRRHRPSAHRPRRLARRAGGAARGRAGDRHAAHGSPGAARAGARG